MKIFLGLIEIVIAILFWKSFSHINVIDGYYLFDLLFGLFLFVSGIGLILKKKWGTIFSLVSLIVLLIFFWFMKDAPVYFGGGF